MYAVDLLEMLEVLVKFHVSTNRAWQASGHQRLELYSGNQRWRSA